MKQNYIWQIKNRFTLFLLLVSLMPVWAASDSSNYKIRDLISLEVSSENLKESKKYSPQSFTATFVNDGNVDRVLWRFLGGNDWDKETSIDSGDSVDMNVTDGEIWEIWDTGDDNLITQWTINYSGGNPEYSFGSGDTGPPEDCDVCQSHGDHDHVSAFYLRYVGPVSPASIQFNTDGYSNTTYSGTH
jgi:hypothetical protein